MTSQKPKRTKTNPPKPRQLKQKYTTVTDPQDGSVSQAAFRNLIARSQWFYLPGITILCTEKGICKNTGERKVIFFLGILLVFQKQQGNVMKKE